MLADDMNRHYDENYGDKIYVPKQNMICALRVDSRWTRGRITDVRKHGNCTVWLVDEGHEVTQHWSILRYLDEPFLKLKEGVAICKLADIKPVDGNRFSDKCFQDFHEICQEAINTIYVKRVRGTMHEVVMTSSSLLDELEDIHVNSHLVKKGYALSTGIESMCIVREKSQDKVAKWLQNADNLDEKQSEAKEMATKEIKIKHYIDPSHFYIHFVSRNEEMQKLQVELQEYVDNFSQTALAYSHHSWALGDHCAVRVALENKPISWYRGTIVAIDEIHTEYAIFLMDEGITQSGVHHNDMLPIHPELAKIKYGAIRCHLAAVGPNDSIDWTLTAKESFLYSAQKFDTISAEIEQDGGNSLGIIVYGRRISNGDALSPASCKWVDINEYLVEQGLIRHIDQQMSVSENTSLSIERALGPNYNNRQAQSMISMHSEPDTDTSLVDCGIIQLNEEVVYDLKAWKPAVPIRRVVFNAYVTYVDVDLNFYLHSQHVHALLAYMKRKINEQLNKEDYAFNDVWKIGQPCLARFIDDNYYRAEILKVDKAKQYCKVAYIDYGNTETVHYNQIKNIVMFADIPKQAHRYYLDNLDPISDTGRWTYTHVRYCLDNSDGKISAIRVNPGFNFDNITGPIPFDIKPTGHRDLRSYLISSEWAKARHTRKSSVSDDKKQSESNKPIEALPAMAESVDINAFKDVEDYEKYFEDHGDKDIELMDEKANSNKSSNFFGDAKGAAAKKTLNGGTGPTEFLDRSEFGLLRSSCFADEQFQDDIWDRMMVHFKPFVPDPRFNQFFVQVYQHLIPSILIVSPSVPPYMDQFKAMQDDIQSNIDSIAEMPNAIAGMPCLAYSKKYECWYRALILGYKANRDRYEIIFVDYMEKNDVRRSQIRGCPAEYMNLPLQVLPVKLHDTKRNRRLRLQDFLRRFYELGHNQIEFYAKIVKEGDLPEVDLFLDEHSTEIFYTPMYAERMFSRNELVPRPSKDLFD